MSIINILLLCTLPFTLGEDYLITDLSQNPGLLADRKAWLTTSSTTWNIIQPKKLQPHFERNIFLIEQVNKLSNLCEKPCTFSEDFERLKQKLSESDKSLKELLDALRPLNKVYKRAILPIWGEVLKILWGSMTISDGENLVNEIQAARNETDHLANLLRKHIELVRDEFSQVFITTTSLKYLISQIQNYTSIKEKDNYFDSSIIAINEAVNQHKDRTLQMRIAILAAINGNFDPYFFKPEIFENSKAKIANTHFHANFPFMHKHLSLSEVSEISQKNILLKNDELLFVISIPLADFTLYNLYQLHILPINKISENNSNIFYFIVPKFLLIKDQHYTENLFSTKMLVT